MTKRPNKFRFYRDARKEWRWTCIAPNGETIGASSEGFKRKAGMLKNAKAMGFVKGVNLEEWEA
jgi:uncharacterized protein YegP (UPF0339 family)